METAADVPSLMEWFAGHGLEDVTPIVKDSPETIAWFASKSRRELFLKLYPHRLADTWAAIEIAIAGASLHPAIVALRQTVACREGMLLVYNRVPGENLGQSDARARFQRLPLAERVAAVSAVCGALGAVCDAGFMIVDWYDSNMLYDFAQKQIWLFDWELCRRGSGFTLEMESNYGSERLMAPEEFVRGSLINQQTLVFNLGRYASLRLPELAEPLAAILARATYPARSGRYASVREFAQAFDKAAV